MKMENDFFSDEQEESFELPLTSFIDTLLVLLIIFIAATPVVNNLIKLSLPDGRYSESNNKKDILILAIDQYGRIYDKNKKIIFLKDLIYEIKNKENKNKDCIIFADKDCLSGSLIELVDIIKDSGIPNVYFKTKKIYI